MANLNIQTLNFGALSAPTRLLLYLMAGYTGAPVKLPYKALSAFLGVSETSVKNYLHTLTTAGCIKYKYSGVIIINPRFWFSGSPDEVAEAIAAYDNFKADTS